MIIRPTLLPSSPPVIIELFIPLWRVEVYQGHTPFHIQNSSNRWILLFVSASQNSLFWASFLFRFLSHTKQGKTKKNDFIYRIIHCSLPRCSVPTTSLESGHIVRHVRCSSIQAKNIQKSIFLHFPPPGHPGRNDMINCLNNESGRKGKSACSHANELPDSRSLSDFNHFQKRAEEKFLLLFVSSFRLLEPI